MSGKQKLKKFGEIDDFLLKAVFYILHHGAVANDAAAAAATVRKKPFSFRRYSIKTIGGSLQGPPPCPFRV